jgi:predicted phage baseplate assembly protein
VKQAKLGDFTLAASGSSDPEVSEYALVASVSAVTTPYPHTRILLRSNLINCYDRNTTAANANVGLATHGQSVSEVMGSGNASTPNQGFTLKQSPLTFVQAPTQTGRQSTLQVQANGVTWTEVPSLYNEGPSQPVFATLNQSDGTTSVQFGDGVEGATLPTGQNNIHANYRIGSGSQGNVGAGALTTLMDRPLGVSGVTNPEAATGGQDPASIDDLRSAAPQAVMTLGRAVSITDYQSYASTFAGIAKAHAIWISSGPGRGVFLTVAGVNGAALPPGNPTLTNLVASLHNFGNPLIPITAQSFLETLFGLSADLQYDPKYDPPAVKAQVLQALSQAYSFTARTFGQGVSVDEVAAVIQAVPGVVAVNVTDIHIVATSAGGDLASQAGGFTLSNLNNWLAQQVTLPRPFSDSPTRICAYLPVAFALAVPLPAEILVLDPDPKSVVLGVMS